MPRGLKGTLRAAEALRMRTARVALTDLPLH